MLCESFYTLTTRICFLFFNRQERLITITWKYRSNSDTLLRESGEAKNTKITTHESLAITKGGFSEGAPKTNEAGSSSRTASIVGAEISSEIEKSVNFSVFWSKQLQL